ncbi:MAG TPA: hypothetical protein VFB00_02975 [Terriglobales bacterium]|nr:hypothetical protein [Terriglobales bacterium]
MFFRHSTDKFIYPLIALGLLLFVSYQPKYRLRTDMPAGFYPVPRAASVQKRSMDERIAWAYWESAQMDVQWRYPYGHPLPMEPPPQFHVDAQALGPGAANLATRKLYWTRLQQVWNLPTSWEKDYEWDWSWASDPMSSGGQWLRDKVRSLFRFQ